MKISIECEPEHLEMLCDALEEYMRIGLGQFDDLARRIAFRDKDYSKYTEAEFDACCQTKDELEKYFREVERIRRRTMGYDMQVNPYVQNVQDFYSIMKHERWLHYHTPGTPIDCIDGYKPLIMGTLNPPKVTIE